MSYNSIENVTKPRLQSLIGGVPNTVFAAGMQPHLVSQSQRPISESELAIKFGERRQLNAGGHN
jgi:hypothetical protein